MTPIEAYKKVSGKPVYSNLQNTRQKRKPKCILGELVGIADVKRVFNRREATLWFDKLYTIT